MEESKNGARTLTDEERVASAAGVPLPPEDLDDVLDNSAPTAAQKPAAAVEVATLEFVDGKPGRSLTLFFPFRLDGQVVRDVFVRPLTVAETSDVITAAAGGQMPDNYAFYSAMTGLPASVLRALPGADGERVTEVAYDFLPRFMRGDASLPIPEDGGA